MIPTLISWIQLLLVSYGVPGVFLAGFLEEVIWVVPSSLIQVSFGFFLFQDISFSLQHVGIFFITVVVPASVGITLGTIPFYALAKWGGRPVLYRYGKYIGITSRVVDRVERKLEKAKLNRIALFSARVAPFIPSTTTTILFGILGMRFSPYLLFTFLGTIPRVLFFGILGWQFGLGYKTILLSWGGAFVSITFSVLFAVVLIILLRKTKKKGSKRG